MKASASWQIAPGDALYPGQLCDLEAVEQPELHGVGRREAVAELDPEGAVTIVGSRRASGYGLRVAERLARDLAATGVVIVSGLARGIDAAAHRGALRAGGVTIAVLASGPDVVYPPSHRALYDDILERGAAISEHPPGSEPHRHHFPARNRIMSALGSVVVIVEGAQPSGSLITADRAARLGRTVGAVPGQLGVRVAEGTNDLIKDGAHLIRDARDVLDLLYGVGVEPWSGPSAGLDVESSPRIGGEPTARPRLERAPAPRPGPALEARLREVLTLVGAGAATLDRIAADGRLAPREAALALVRLELLGYVDADPLGAYQRTGLEAPPE